MSREWSEAKMVSDFEESYREEHPFENFRMPTHKIVCPTCNGKGTHVNPAIDGNGITRSEMDELGPDFFEDYMTGVYDVICTDCRGQNVIDEVDEDRLDPEIRAQWHDWQREEYEYRAEVRAEQRYFGY